MQHADTADGATATSLLSRLVRGLFAGFGEASCAFHALPTVPEPAAAVFTRPERAEGCVVLTFPLERRRAEAVPVARNLATAR